MDRLYSPRKPYKPTEPTRLMSRLYKSKPAGVIYRDISVLGDDDYGLERIEEYFENQEEVMPSEPDIRYWQRLSLQDILDLAPAGTRLCDIILSIDVSESMPYIDVTFSKYERDLEAEEASYQDSLKKYQKDMIEYDKAMVEYEKELAVYNEWLNEQQVKQLEKQIRELKKSK